MRCEACGRQCRVVTVDFGIGPYEYWGSCGVDVQLASVSDCCEADVLEGDDPVVVTEADIDWAVM